MKKLVFSFITLLFLGGSFPSYSSSNTLKEVRIKQSEDKLRVYFILEAPLTPKVSIEKKAVRFTTSKINVDAIPVRVSPNTFVKSYSFSDEPQNLSSFILFTKTPLKLISTKRNFTDKHILVIEWTFEQKVALNQPKRASLHKKSSLAMQGNTNPALHVSPAKNEPINRIGEFLKVGIESALMVGYKKTEAVSPAFFFSYQDNMDGYLLGGFLSWGFRLAENLFFAAEGAFKFARIDNKSKGYQGAAYKNTMNRASDIIAKFGYYLSPETYIYKFAGVAFRNFQYTVEHFNILSPDFPKSYKNRFMGLLIGSGTETLISNNLSIRFDVRQFLGPTLHKSANFFMPISNQNLTMKAKITLKTTQMNVGLIYHFHTHNKNFDIKDHSGYSGFYAGGSFGTGSINTKRHIVNSLGTLNSLNGDMDVLYGLTAGYGHFFERFYLSLEGQYFIRNADIKGGDFSRDFYRDRIKNFLSISVRPGFLISNQTVFYAHTGLSTFSFDHTGQYVGASQNIIGKSRIRKRLYGMNLGFGMETFYSKHISMRTQFLHHFFKRIPVNGNTFTGYIKPGNNQFTFGIAFIF